jgi:hypothetical protein
MTDYRKLPGQSLFGQVEETQDPTVSRDEKTIGKVLLLGYAGGIAGDTSRQGFKMDQPRIGADSDVVSSG